MGYVSTVCFHIVFPQCVFTSCFHNVFPQTPRQHRDNIETTARQIRDNTETSPRENRVKTETKPRQPRQSRDKSRDNGRPRSGPEQQQQYTSSPGFAQGASATSRHTGHAFAHTYTSLQRISRSGPPPPKKTPTILIGPIV